MFILVIPLGYFYVFTKNFEPFHRGFYCDDQTIKHPYKQETISLGQVILMWLAVDIVFIFFIETIRFWAGKENPKPYPISGSMKIPWIATELYRHFGYFGLGALGCLVFTEVAKYTIGRLRPHFLTLCHPNLSVELCQKDGYNRFVTEDESMVCLGLDINGGNTTAKQLHEARLSFMSGHTAFSFYCAAFLVVYLQARLSNFPPSNISWVVISYRTIKVFRPFLQFCSLTLAFWISLTRISDYFHHPEDVIAGAFVGLAFACLTLLVIVDVFNKETSFRKSLVGFSKNSDAEKNGGSSKITKI